ncbi:hypothetical protein JL722_12676 [Aureococcus anophagefferens]|nr:hypothetical protein JL722_12676 [Aureococcus anophagefferens]
MGSSLNKVERCLESPSDVDGLGHDMETLDLENEPVLTLLPADDGARWRRPATDDELVELGYAKLAGREFFVNPNEAQLERPTVPVPASVRLATDDELQELGYETLATASGREIYVRLNEADFRRPTVPAQLERPTVSVPASARPATDDELRGFGYETLAAASGRDFYVRLNEAHFQRPRVPVLRARRPATDASSRSSATKGHLADGRSSTATRRRRTGRGRSSRRPAAALRVDRGAFLDCYARLATRLSALTPHQREKLDAVRAARVAVLTAPAGGGKTFVAIQLAREVLQEAPSSRVLFVSRNQALALFVVKWLVAAKRTSAQRVADRIDVLVAPFGRGPRQIRVKRPSCGREMLVLVEPAEAGEPRSYDLIVVDEAHHLAGDEEAREALRAVGAGNGDSTASASTIASRSCPDAGFAARLRAPLSRALGESFELVDAATASATLPPGEDEDEDWLVVVGGTGDERASSFDARPQRVVVDTVDGLDGLERLIVVCAGLDRAISEDAATLETRSRLYRAMTRAQLALTEGAGFDEERAKFDRLETAADEVVASCAGEGGDGVREVPDAAPGAALEREEDSEVVERDEEVADGGLGAVAVDAVVQESRGRGGAKGLGVAVFHDGRRVVSGSADKTVKVWDAATGECVATLAGHSKEVLGVAVFPDGRRVVSGSGDKTVKVWDAATGESSVAVFPTAGASSPQRSSDKTVKVWGC